MTNDSPAPTRHLQFNALRLGLASRVLPFFTPKTILFDKKEIIFSQTDVRHFLIPKLEYPTISDNYALNEGRFFEFDCAINKTEVLELTKFVQEIDQIPLIEFVPFLITPPRVLGRRYRNKIEADQAMPEQESLLPDLKCKHNLTPKTCFDCTEERERKMKLVALVFDAFDFILPILQPPLKLEANSELLPGKELLPFQPEGISFLASNTSALLGDDMGLGKTIQAIVATVILFHSGKIQNALIICPKSVQTSWERELEGWAPGLRVSSIKGPKALRLLNWSAPAHIYLTTYEILREDSENIPQTDFDLCILDEVQKIKNPSSQIAQSVHQIKAKFRWGLSGTPLENRAEELVAIFSYLKPGLLQYKDSSNTRYIKEKIKPFFKRRRKEDVLKELPEKVKNIGWVSLNPKQQEAYERVEKEGVVALNEQGENITVTHIFALMNKLKQICNFDIVSGESSKLEYLTDKLESIEEQDDKILIFSQYPNSTLEFLNKKLQKFCPLIFQGSLSQTQRDNVVQKFKNNPDNRILLTSIKAGGVGLNLQRANYVFHFDQWWNPATMLQAEDRTHRIGQTKIVFVTALMATNTIEEKIYDILERKRALFTEIIDDLSSDLIEKLLTKEELFSLFNLNVSKQKIANTPKDKTLMTFEDLRNITPLDFEKLVGKLYGVLDYKVRLTPKTRDEGVDLYAERILDSGSESLIIQCKHYPERSVGVEYVRELNGVLNAKSHITKGILITSGQFSNEAKKFAEGKRIELKDGNKLLALLAKYNILPD